MLHAAEAPRLVFFVGGAEVGRESEKESEMDLMYLGAEAWLNSLSPEELKAAIEKLRRMGGGDAEGKRRAS